METPFAHAEGANDVAQAPPMQIQIESRIDLLETENLYNAHLPTPRDNALRCGWAYVRTDHYFEVGRSAQELASN